MSNIHTIGIALDALLQHLLISIAGGKGFALLFKNGETVCRVEEEKAVDILMEETKKLIDEKSKA